MSNTTLFSPVQLGPYTLPNRMAMAPMTRNRAGEGNVPQPINAEYYAQRVSAGLIITEATQISPHGVGYPATPGIHSAEQIDGWKRVTDAVHAKGAHIFLQLWHVGRISHPSLQPNGATPVAPSAIKPSDQVLTYQGMQITKHRARSNSPNSPASSGNTAPPRRTRWLPVSTVWKSTAQTGI